MPAYVLAEIDVTDAAAYENYKKLVPGTIAAFGGKYLVRGGETVVLEGAPAKRMALVQFDSVDKAQAWWNSAAYQAPKAMRQAASRGRLIILPGVD